jgi:tRNA(Arg) A34 adenosine deaminase TadA
LIDDARLLRLAVEAAWRARELGNLPFGAVLAGPGGDPVLAAENTTVTGDCTGHAELNLVRLACTQFTPGQLAPFSIYSSAEPCAMCAGAIVWSGVGRVVFGLSEADVHAMVPEGGRLPLPCRAVFERADRPIEVVGPLATDEAWAVHRSFWT